MAAKCRVARTAEVDLLEIWTYIAEDDLDQADAQTRRIFNHFEQLAMFPQSGRVRDDLEPGIRSSVVDKYVVLYHIIQAEPEILHVVSGYRDIAALFS